MLNSKFKLLSQVNFFLTGFKKKFAFLIILITINSFLELISIGIFIPALNFFIKKQDTFFSFFDLSLSYSQSLLIIFLIILIIFVIKFLFFVFLISYENKFIKKINLFYSQKLLNILLNKPLIFHLNKNSSESINLVKNIQAVNAIFSSIILLFIDLFTVTLIFIFMLNYEFYATISVLFIIGFATVTYYLTTRNLLFSIGRTKYQSEARILKNLKEIFNGIKEIKIFKAFDFFSKDFLSYQNKYLSTINKLKIITSLPRVFLELLMIFFFGIILVIFFLNNYELDEIIIKLGIFTLVSLKILPVINRVLYNFQNLKSNKFSFEQVYLNLSDENKSTNINRIEHKEISFLNNIEFKNVNFSYDKKNNVLNNLDFNIKKGQSIGIFGPSGSGKSTFINMLCGFIKPDSGSITVDGIEVDLYNNYWLNKISYVPQDIFLSDNNLLYNIAYGQVDHNYNKDKINNLIINLKLDQFTKQYEKNIGEDGLKISGGQRQRVGIARALYKNSQLIILDEATSSLDENTEESILKFIFKNSENKTKVIVSHKPSTLKFCDYTYMLEDGKLIKKDIV